MTLTEFLLARIAEDEAAAREVPPPPGRRETFSFRFDSWESDHSMQDRAFVDRFDPVRVLAECEAKRRIVERHKSWPVLAETPPTFETVGSDLDSVTFRASRQIAWLTEQEYRVRFGSEPPTAPMLRALAAVYADHPDYDEAWRD